jgi:hypothetical protein
MAFCNSCGATLNPGTQFCNKCGAAVTGPSQPATPQTPQTAGYAATPAPAATGGSNALKIVLIVVAVIVVIGIIGLAGLGFVAHHFITKNVHVTQDGNQVKVDTPFGKMETNKDPDQVARDLGVDIYPGAQVEKNSAATATFGGMHTVAASFESSDSLDKVCAFYKSKFPNAMVSTSAVNRCTIVSSDQKNMITINIEAKGDATKIQISNVSKASGSSN